MPKKIVITGGPGSGKTSLINFLAKHGFQCVQEISREITLQAQKEGIDQLFLTDPILFSQKLLEGRLKQFKETYYFQKSILFYDRGLPDITAYMDYTSTNYPNYFKETCQNYRYDFVFLLPPWEEIYLQDNERYETFEEAKKIYINILNTYKNYGYNIVEVPSGSLEFRMNFIKKYLSV